MEYKLKLILKRQKKAPAMPGLSFYMQSFSKDNSCLFFISVFISLKKQVLQVWDFHCFHNYQKVLQEAASASMKV